MKEKWWRRVAILGILVVSVAGCEREEEELSQEEEFPQAVELVSPAEGAEFADSAPVFVWRKEPLAASYVFKITANDFSTGAVLFEDTLADTVWEMSQHLFFQIYQGSYRWGLAPLPKKDSLLWSETRTFKVDKSCPEPAPLMISPEDGAVFDVARPGFVWHKVNSASSYVIRIVKDAFFTGELLIEDTLTDTAYTMSQNDFEVALNADYVWSVAPLYSEGGPTWREFRGLTFNKPMPALDLDTTYFPLGMGYEWTYQRHIWGADYSDPDDPDPPVWDYYDTITLRVADSVFGVNGWEFHLEGYLFHDTGDTVYIFGNRVLVFNEEKIPLNPTATGEIEPNQGVEIIYRSDTLQLSYKLSETWEPIGGSWSQRTASRIKGVGVVTQLSESSSYGHGWSKESNTVDTLLYFVKGQDTIWRREEP